MMMLVIMFVGYERDVCLDVSLVVMPCPRPAAHGVLYFTINGLVLCCGKSSLGILVPKP